MSPPPTIKYQGYDTRRYGVVPAAFSAQRRGIPVLSIIGYVFVSVALLLVAAIVIYGKNEVFATINALLKRVTGNTALPVEDSTVAADSVFDTESPGEANKRALRAILIPLMVVFWVFMFIYLVVRPIALKNYTGKVKETDKPYFVQWYDKLVLMTAKHSKEADYIRNDIIQDEKLKGTTRAEEAYQFLNSKYQLMSRTLKEKWEKGIPLHDEDSGNDNTMFGTYIKR